MFSSPSHYEPLPYPIGLITLAQRLSQNIAQNTEEQNKLREALHRAETLTAEKAQFAAYLSHEVRNPINAIQGLCENALEDSEAPHATVISKIHHCAIELDKLIKDVLDFSCLESGAMAVEAIPFNPILEFEKTAQRLHPMAQRKGIEFIALINPDAPHCVQGDPTKFRRIINNLVDNATKFTTHGSITCELKFITRTPFIHAEVIVTDTGVGIPAHRLERIFEPFTQAEASTTRCYGGTGLGLAITRKLSRAMRGDVKVQSIVNQGSQFTATCIFDAVENLPALEAPNLYHHHILIVGGSTLSRNWLADCLRFQNATITLAISNDEAESLWSSAQLSVTPFTHALIDVPADTTPRLPSIPSDKIILLTEPELELRGYHQLTKPITLSNLWGKFSPPVHTTVETNPSTPEKVLRHRPLRILIAEDNEVNREVTVSRLKRAGHEVSATVDGSAALELWRSKEFDLAILDLQMPLLDGIELARSIRSEEKAGRRRPTPLIALTGMAEQNIPQLCREAGFNDYLTKPMRGHDLLLKINEIICSLNNQSNQHEFIALLEQSSEDEIEDLHIAGRAFLRHCDQLIIELTETIKKPNKDGLILQVHGIKGMLSLMGCVELAKLASRIEYNPSSPIAKENTQLLINGLRSLKLNIGFLNQICDGKTEVKSRNENLICGSGEPQVERHRSQRSD